MKRDGGSALAVLDLDLRNAFPSFEWEQIRSAVGEHTPDIADWTRWCHAEENFVILPCGRVIWSNRGAEQGDPLGSLHCGLVLINVVKETRDRMRASLGVDGEIFFDAWYMDDGQIILHPSHADLFFCDYSTKNSKKLVRAGVSWKLVVIPLN